MVLVVDLILSNEHNCSSNSPAIQARLESLLLGMASQPPLSTGGSVVRIYSSQRLRPMGSRARSYLSKLPFLKCSERNGLVRCACPTELRCVGGILPPWLPCRSCWVTCAAHARHHWRHSGVCGCGSH